MSPTSPNGPHTPKSSLLGKSLDFQASLVVDLVYHRTFSDKATWHRCIGVYLTPWMGAEPAEAFSETVRSHYLAIDKVRCPLSRDLHVSQSLYSQRMLLFNILPPMKARFSVILFSRLHTVPCYSYHTLLFVSFAVAGMESLEPTDPANRLYFASYATAKSKTFLLSLNSDVSWSSTLFKARMDLSQCWISLRQVNHLHLHICMILELSSICNRQSTD